jgi:signal transduction histidine kinase
VEARLAVNRARSEAEAAREALERAHAQLELRIAERTAELERSNEALAAEIATRNDLQRRLNSAREDEQRRTARDLHDQVGQTLSALTLTIKAACEAETLPAAALSRLEDALQLAGLLGRDIHDLATRLRPAVLDAFGLHAALRQLLTDWSHHHGTPVDFEATWLKSKRFAADIETVLYRVTQEALTNVARHAQATHVSVVVELNAGHITAIVEDDGCGFDVEALELGRMGLEGMRERATLVDGTFDIESARGAGTTVFVSIPIAEGTS